MTRLVSMAGALVVVVIAGCFSVKTVTRLDLGTRFIHSRDTNAEGPNAFESWTQTLITRDDPNTPEDETEWGPLVASMHASSSGIASSALQSASRVWAASARRPDNIQISGLSNASAASKSDADADAKARTEQKQGQGQGQNQDQDQEQDQYQDQDQDQDQDQEQGQEQGQEQDQEQQQEQNDEGEDDNSNDDY